MELICPNCHIRVEIKTSSSKINATICPKCLEQNNKRFIMIESQEQKPTNLGGGFFEKN